MSAPRTVRGRTSAGRLRGADALLLQYVREAALSADGLFVDLGFGERPDTTLELAQALWTVNRNARVVGIDVAPHRVEQAKAHAPPGVDFRCGSFAATHDLGEPVAFVRAMNVLRSYRVEDLPNIRATLVDALAVDGLLLEGSSDTAGDVLTAHLVRRNRYDGLYFFTSFARGFAPRLFRDWLPRELRRNIRPGTEIHALFERWTAEWEALRGAPLAQADLFQRSAASAGLRVLGEGGAIWDEAPRLPLGSPSR